MFACAHICGSLWPWKGPYGICTLRTQKEMMVGKRNKDGGVVSWSRVGSPSPVFGVPSSPPSLVTVVSVLA